MPDIRPSLRIALASCVLAATCLHAQQVPDPANLTGEHVSPPALADTLPLNHGAPALEQLLVKLRTRASMMLIVAHPDDEDGGFLTYESRGQGARVAMLTLNRGEGGQNLMSADFDDALGLIRTQELLAADRYMGVDQFFGTEVDFGFSKTKEEAFAKWTHDRVLYDAVRCVRLYRPLVVASVFVGGVTDGHGQHQVSGEIAQEVFTAAADPKVFPEMGLPPWAPLKVYARVPFSRVTQQGMFDYATGKWSRPVFRNYVTGKDIDHEPTVTVTIHEGEKSTLIGMGGDTYSQFARKGLGLQKSQNGGLGRGPGGGGGGDVSYTLMGSRLAAQKPTEESVFDGIDTSLPGIATLAPDAPGKLGAVLQIIDMKIAEAQKAFDPAHPEATAKPLRLALQTLDTVIAGTEGAKLDATEKFNLLHELRVKRVQLNNALVLAHGLHLEARVTDGIRGETAILLADWPKTTLTEKLTNDGTEPIKFLNSGATSSAEISTTLIDRQNGPKANADLAPHLTAEFSFRATIAHGLPATRPYFSRPSSEQPFYDVSDPNLRNAPATPNPLTAWATFDDQGVELRIESPVTDNGSAEYNRGAVAIPRLSVALSPSAGIIPLSDKSVTLTTHVTSHAPAYEESTFVINSNFHGAEIPATGTVHLEGPVGWHIEPASVPWNLSGPGQHTMLKFVANPSHLISGSELSVRAVSTLGRMGSFDIGFRAVGYKGLTYTNYYTPATYKATAVDVTTAPGLKVAYLPGTGDSVPDFLPNLGVTPTIIGLADLTPEKLANFDILILGVRAYAAHAELSGAGSQPIINFAKSGGVVIVQYNNGKYGEAEAPYPITTVGSSGDHAHDVVDETRPVEVLEPKAPLLTWPNKITSADFNNWVDERGHAFAGTWSKEYTALLETHDPGQEPQKGGLLVAPVGKGAYIYCGLALYRQLPEGVPGAYRLFANLLSYAKNPSR